MSRAALKQADEFGKPNARTYRYLGAGRDPDYDTDDDALDTSGPDDPTDEFDA